MPEPLTELERRILDYLVDYLRRNTFQPSIREIGQQFRIKSTKTVSEYLQSLADKGWIERDPSRSRGVRLLGVDLHAEVVTLPCYTVPCADGNGGAGTAGLPGPAGVAAEGYGLDRRLVGVGTFLVRMQGDSMVEAGIEDGDLVLVAPVDGEALRDGDIVVARVDGELTVKRYFRRGPDVLLEPASADYAPTFVPGGGSLAVLGRATGVIRRFDQPRPADDR